MSSGFACSFFLQLSAGKRKVTPKSLLFPSFKKIQLWPAEDLLSSLDHLTTLYHLFWFFHSLMLSPPRSPLSDLSSLGPIKPPGRRNSKHWTWVGSPESHKPLQPFLRFIKREKKNHFNEVHFYVPKGQLFLNFHLHCYKIIQYKCISFWAFLNNSC